MAETDETAATAADVARDEAVRMLVSMGVQVGVLLILTWVIENREGLLLRGRRIAARVRPRREPGDAGLQAAEFAAAVSAWDHGRQA